MLAHCRPDFVLRPFATSRLVEREAPYRGHAGLLAYMRDVATVWDELTMTVLTIRRAEESVIGFGRADGRRPGNRMVASLMWIVRLEEGQIASMEVFQAAGEDALSPDQMARLSQALESGLQ
jgi:ketosteroid isomerase-like protein